MKKTIAVIVSVIVLLMLIEIPTFAEGDNAPTDETTTEGSVETLPEEENATEGEISGEEATEAPAEEVPEETPEEVPEETPEETPEEIPEETPEEVPEETPEEVPEEAPEESPTEPVATPTEPIEQPTEIPTEPVEIPTEAVETPTEPTENIGQVLSDKVVAWIQTHLADIGVILTLLFNVLYQILKSKKLNKSIATLNNNSVKITDRSNEAIKENLSAISAYKQEMSDLLAEVRETAEEKKKNADALAKAENLMDNARTANVELSNVLAELLVLANIPNSKKEELYARHRAAVAKMEVADDSGTEE